jgi:hypothetical protein
MKAILKTRGALNLISTFLFHLDSKFGIVAGDIRAELVKVPRTGMFLALIFVKV